MPLLLQSCFKNGHICNKLAAIEQEVLPLSDPQDAVLGSDRPLNLFLAGIGSGKTHLGGVLSYRFIDQFPNAYGFIGANTYQQLNTSTMLRIRTVWKEVFKWIEGRDYVVGKKPKPGWPTDNHNFERYDGIISFASGAVVFTGSLDNAAAHDGKQFAWALLDETKDSREDDVKEVIMGRLRQQAMYWSETGELISAADVATKLAAGYYQKAAENRIECKGVWIEPFNPLYILTSPAKVDWINRWFELDKVQPEIEAKIYSKTQFFFSDRGDKSVVISSTWHNSDNLPAGYIERQINNLTPERAASQIYGNPFSRTGGEFYSGFDRTRHIKQVPYLPHLPVHLSFDQNVNPYITVTCWQIEEGARTVFRCFDEICLPNPRNTTEALCQEFSRRWSEQIKQGGQTVFFYGDASGNRQDTRSKLTDYAIVKRELRPLLNNFSDRTLNRNPSVSKRRDWINNILDGKYPIDFVIDDGCQNTIADYVYLKQDKNGKKLKEVVTDPQTRVSYEKYGHTSDTGDYLLTTVLSNEFERFCSDQ